MDTFFSTHILITLFLIIGIGLAVGQLSIKGFSLGSSAILFIALIFGHFGISLPKEIGDLGVILFVYAVGLQVGPRFFRTMLSKGTVYFWIALIGLSVSALVVYGMVNVFNISGALGIGLFAGALTSTPGYAAALDVLNDPQLSVGYGMAYPFGIIGVIVFVQSVFKLPQTQNDIFEEKHSPTAVENKVHVKKFQVTNPNCTGKSLVEIHFHGMTKANITRVKRGDMIFMAYDDTVLNLDDIIMAVGTDKELLKLENLLGKESHAEMDYVKDIVGRDVFVSSPKIVGKTLKELEVKELFGVVITRLRREEVEMVPCGNTSLEVGDLIHVVGDAEDCERFVTIVGQKERRIHETNLLPLALGIVCGSCLGVYPIRLPGEITFKLGLAGGPLLVALVIGHFGRIGRLSTRIPYPAKYITREIGLAFFLAVAGTKAGGSFYEVFKQSGPLLMLYGAIITTTVIITFYGLSRFLFKLSNLASIGVVCGAMTCTPALSVINDKVESETPTINYASIYAIAMVLITVISQILALALK